MSKVDNNSSSWKVAIHESKSSSKVIDFANSGYGMSRKWWRETYRLDVRLGVLWGVYKVPSGLRREVR